MSNVATIPRSAPVVGFGELVQMADAMAASGFFGFKTCDQALSIMLIAQANGQHPASAAQDYDVIQGKPAKKPQAMLRDFLSSGGRVEWHEATDAAAEATFSHGAGGSLRVRWDMARAQKMGFAGKDNWKKQPGVMLRWRCVAEGVRFVYPSSTGGMYSPDEISDFDAPKATPHAAQVTGAGDTFKAQHDAALRAAAEQGTEALQAAFKAATGEGKAEYWTANSAALKAIAANANIVDVNPETGEVIE